jgi:hypothetical protein
MKRAVAVALSTLAAAALFTAFALASSSPAVKTGSVTKITQTSGVLNATVNPNGSATTYYFEWGLTSGYGATSHPHSAGSGTKASSVHATAAALIPGTVYHYRIVALNKFGGSLGADKTFKTGGSSPPVAATGSPTQVGSTSVTMTGVVNPNGAATSWAFEYGITAAYESETIARVLPAGPSAQTVSVSIRGLAPGTIFHYQLLAAHSGFPPQGGGDHIFMTKPSPAPRPRVLVRTSPHRAPHRPFRFTTSGRVAGPRSIPAAFACSGSVRVRFLFGHRQVAFSLANLQPNCTFSAQTVLARKPGHAGKGHAVQLLVLVRYLGNGYLAQSLARPASVVVG